MAVEYNGLGVIHVKPVQKAIDIIKDLPAEKLYAAIYILELIASGDTKTKPEEINDLRALKMAGREPKPQEITEGGKELKAGLEVMARDIWDDLDDEEVDKIYEELYLLR